MRMLFSNIGNFSLLLIGGDKDWPTPLTQSMLGRSPLGLTPQHPPLVTQTSRVNNRFVSFVEILQLNAAPHH